MTARSDKSRVEIAERFRAAGLKVTPQRLAIYHALLKTKQHPNPEALHRAVLPSMPALSLATVYKALDVLEAHGLVETVSRVGETKRYDANKTPHHHLVCTQCFAIEDVYLPEVDAAMPKARTFPGFKITGMHIQVLGLCEGCSSREVRKHG